MEIYNPISADKEELEKMLVRLKQQESDTLHTIRLFGKKRSGDHVYDFKKFRTNLRNLRVLINNMIFHIKKDRTI